MARLAARSICRSGHSASEAAGFCFLIHSTAHTKTSQLQIYIYLLHFPLSLIVCVALHFHTAVTAASEIAANTRTVKIKTNKTLKVKKHYMMRHSRWWPPGHIIISMIYFSHHKSSNANNRKTDSVNSHNYKHIFQNLWCSTAGPHQCNQEYLAELYLTYIYSIFGQLTL